MDTPDIKSLSYYPAYPFARLIQYCTAYSFSIYICDINIYQGINQIKIIRANFMIFALQDV